MALFQISNEKITVQADSLGAELKSLKSVDDGQEYMWNGDPKFWGRTSPVLFPFVGGLHNSEYYCNGKSYPMGQHGFARDMEFRLKSQVSSEIWFELTADDETLRKYPFAFCLEIGYELKDRTVIVKWRVKNSAEEKMYFSIGGHPAFLCPIDEGTKQSEYSIRFDAKNEVVSSCLEGGLLTENRKTYALKDGILPVTETLFDADALIIEKDQAHKVSLVKPDGRDYLTVSFDAPLFGIWSPPKKNAPFICIEPWYGRCDRAGFTGDIAKREWEQALNAGETFEAQYTITI